MLNRELLDPRSIAIIGGSDDVTKPGGRILKNLLDGRFAGEIYAVNPGEIEVQGVKLFSDINELPDVDLAIIAVPAAFCIGAVDIMANKKNTRAFIIVSAGFSELNREGKLIEEKIVSIINQTGGVLIGPNGIGVLTSKYRGIFTEPVPEMNPGGVDFISGSGAAAVFIMENGIGRGLTFANVFSVGNCAQTGVEDILMYMDETFDALSSPRIKILYLENIRNPRLLLKHATSLVNKGCSIAAVKAGSSEAGSRAASSHTGALATPDSAVDALFRKAGIVRCFSRDELVTVAGVFSCNKARGKNFAVITHAGGPGVMLTDTLSKNGLKVPVIKNDYSECLLKKLYPGSSVSNPVDFLATGTAEQLGAIIDFIDEKADEIDAMIVIFGTPGLTRIFDVYNVLHDKMMNSSKPIYPVFPSVKTAADEIKEFVSKGHVYFPDEVLLGEALSKVYNTHGPFNGEGGRNTINRDMVRNVIDKASAGFLSQFEVQNLLDACSIPRVNEYVARTADEALKAAGFLSYPVVLKAAGPVHKSDVGGVSLNINNDTMLAEEFNRLMVIPGAEGVIMQPMLSGIELFIGTKLESTFGHLILCGMGGILVELLNDVSEGLVPVDRKEAINMISSLKSYKVFKGIRGLAPVDENVFADIILKLSELLEIAPEISELDFNPLLADRDKIIVVDARIKIV